MSENIYLKDVLSLTEPEKFKLHLACRNEDWVSPLDEYVANHSNWVAWNEWKGAKNDWTRDYIFTLIEFYPRPSSWLFGGIFKVIKRHDDRYEIEELSPYKKFVGRLLINFHRYQGMRGRAFYLENYIDDFIVDQIFPSSYSGETFPGFENICHDFSNLEAIFKSERPDWKAALSSIKGVYLISDKNNGKKYVGSAYGDGGVWSRWSAYIYSGHGSNVELESLIKSSGLEYARLNFQFTLLEVISKVSSDDFVISRECHWKNALLSRGHGYNGN